MGHHPSFHKRSIARTGILKNSGTSRDEDWKDKLWKEMDRIHREKETPRKIYSMIRNGERLLRSREPPEDEKQSEDELWVEDVKIGRAHV